MKLVLIWLGAVAAIEVLLWWAPLWHLRKYLATLCLLGLGFSSGALLGVHLAVWSALVVAICVYRAVNLLRLIKGRTQPDYLFRVARRSSFTMILAQGLVLALAAANDRWQLSDLTWWYLLASLQLAVALLLLASTRRHLEKSQPPKLTQHYSDRELPSLTVAIPARNETEQLERCLESLIDSDYPKLEILVLDDCSQNKRTPEIIRDYAQYGVRWLAGQAPPQHWLAKNYAYQQLAEQASGELILFCGVDLSFEKSSLRTVVEILLTKHKSMLSCLPANLLPKRSPLRTFLLQPARYAWELSLPRRLLQRPPVLSTCWLITADALRASGGFAAVASSSSPESFMAKTTAHASDGYSFLISSDAVGLMASKTLPEQLATAVRTRYPQNHRRPELVGLNGLLEASSLVAPYVVLVLAILGRVWPLAVLSLVSVAALTSFYYRIVNLTYRRTLKRGLVLLPIAALYDIWVLNFSLWSYEFGEVLWKGRNVCVPIMRTYPKLPRAS